MASGRISRVFRIVGWVAATGVLAVAVVLGVLLLPPVQRSLLVRVLGRNGATAIVVGKFHATP
jgi:hypothetical protein